MSYNPQNPNGQATSANSSPVVVASDQPAVPVSASSLPLPAGAATASAQTSGAQKSQIVDGSGNVVASTSNALNVNIVGGAASGDTQYAEGATAATATGTLAMGKNGTTLKAAQTDASGNLRVDLSQTSANAIALKVDGSGATQPVSGTVTANAGTNLNTSALALESGGNLAAAAINTAGLNNTVGTAGSAVPTKGVVVQGSDGTDARAIKTDASGNVNVNVQGTVPVSGSFYQATQPVSLASLPALPAGSNTIGAISNTSFAATQATAANLNATVVGTGTFATQAAQSGTWTVQPGNTPNTAPWLVSLQPASSGGWSVASQTALTNTIVSIKASSGQFGGYMFNNPNASTAYIQVFNNTTGGAALGSPTYVIAIPPMASANVEFANGIAHSTAISAAATTAPTGTLAPTTALTGFFLYK